jgi:hypothetical protein
MAAGLGFKDFVTGEVLTAADVDGYLMQGVWVFADAAARTAAVTSPQEGNVSFLKDTNSTEYYSGSAWVAIGGSVPTSYGYAAGKNAIINGNFGVWQRGTSFSAIGFTADRWYTTTTNAITRSTTAPTGFNYSLNWVTSGSYPVVATYVELPVTGAKGNFTGTWVMSFYAKASTATTMTTEAYWTDGSARTNVVSIASQGNSLTTSWQRFTMPVNFDSSSPNGTNKAIELTNYVVTGGATINITGVQLEAGSTATDFQTATGTIQGELAACQRYYFRNTQTGNNQHLTPFGSAVSSTAAAIDVFFPVSMRTNPTAIESANLAVTDGANARTNVTSVTFNASSNLVANCEYNVASGLTQYRPYSLFNQTSTTAYVGFSAEL